MIVQLTWPEKAAAAFIGRMRFEKSRADGRSNQHGLKAATPELDVRSAQAELAVAKALGIYWTMGVDTFHGPDLGSNIQVRYTKYATGKLILRKGDNPDHKYYLVASSRDDQYRVVGWIYGRDGMLDKWTAALDKSRPACWAVPQSSLQVLK